jgi:hypothetical protein
MIQTVTNICKWVSIPALAMASMLSRFAGTYEILVDIAICAGAMIVVQRAVRSREYLWAAGLVPIVVVFGPVTLLIKVFLLMGLTCVAMAATMFVVFRTQPVVAK